MEQFVDNEGRCVTIQPVNKNDEGVLRSAAKNLADSLISHDEAIMKALKFDLHYNIKNPDNSACKNVFLYVLSVMEDPDVDIYSITVWINNQWVSVGSICRGAVLKNNFNIDFYCNACEKANLVDYSKNCLFSRKIIGEIVSMGERWDIEMKNRFDDFKEPMISVKQCIYGINKWHLNKGIIPAAWKFLMLTHLGQNTDIIVEDSTSRSSIGLMRLAGLEPYEWKEHSSNLFIGKANWKYGCVKIIRIITAVTPLGKKFVESLKREEKVSDNFWDAL